MKRFFKIVKRELALWARRPIYLLGSFGVMLISTIFYLSFFREGLPENLPIGIVDMDCSSTSRNFASQLDATQLGSVIDFPSVAQARREMETGRICGYVVIPEKFDEEVQAFRCPKLGVYVNGMNPVIGGALAYKDILFMVNLTNGAVQRQVLRAKGVPKYEIMAKLQPLNLDAHYIGNAPTNYGYYLNNMILTGILALCIVLVVVYSLGAEMKYKSSTKLLEMSGDSIFRTLAAKLFPYTILFTALGVTLQLILFGPLHYPLAGSIWAMILSMLLLVLAYESIAVFIFACTPTLRLAVCIAALYGVLGFSFAGFTLPISSLPAGIRGMSALYPLHFYYNFYVQEAIFGTGFTGWWTIVLSYLVFLFLPLLCGKRIYKAYKYQDYPQS